MNADGNMLWIVQYAEMADHLKSRIEYHSKRNEELVSESKRVNDSIEAELAEAEDTAALMALKSNTMYGNASNRRDQLRSSARTHATKATVFQFFLTHLPPQKEFDISQEELVRLEFIPYA
jgi:uncharacterized phage infection (PIP) family protein YhgE